MLLNCGSGETLLRVPWTARSNQLILKEINPEYSLEDWCWSWSSNTLATWYEELNHWGKKNKKTKSQPRCWERLRSGGEGGDRGWDGWMALPAQWTWVWANSGRQWTSAVSNVLLIHLLNFQFYLLYFFVCFGSLTSLLLFLQIPIVCWNPSSHWFSLI